MKRSDFWLIVGISSLVSAGLVVFFLLWWAPPHSQALEESALSQSVSPAPPLQLTEDEQVNVDVYQKVGPSVVNITSTTIEYTWFFDPVPRQGVGSGFILDTEGHIATNFHVIEGARLIEVTLFDETVIEGEVIGQDPVNDVAILKIDCSAVNCVPVTLGSSDNLAVGQKVLAIGNPFGLQRTLTTGIISSIGRSLKTDYGFIENVIQTDAAINPGNSGGPLLNGRGELIGINTAIFSTSGDSAGIGFAVPVKTVKRILPDLLAFGKVIRPWHGLLGRPLRPRLARFLKSPVESGFLVEAVESGSSADRAGIRGGTRTIYLGNSRLVVGGDILISLAGRTIESGYDIIRALEDKKPGEKIEVTFYREGRRIEGEMELVARETERRFRF